MGGQADQDFAQEHDTRRLKGEICSATVRLQMCKQENCLQQEETHIYLRFHRKTANHITDGVIKSSSLCRSVCMEADRKVNTVKSSVIRPVSSMTLSTVNALHVYLLVLKLRVSF